ncbi:MAG: FAD binding domain-containing protein [Gemmatimonadaceae bacterium]
MRTALSALQLVRPRSLADALTILRDDPTLVPVAGTTDIYVTLNFGTTSAMRFLDLWPLDALRGITVRDGVLSLGALTTYTEIIRSRHVKHHLPILAEAARVIGGVQIQNRGTIGGNIANASPAGDTLPVLAVAEAVMVLRSADATRRVPFTSFYTGYRKTALAPGELIVAVEVPPVEGAQWYRKVGTRAAQAISKVVMAAVRSRDPRISLGSVAPTVVRLPRTEAALAAGGSAGAARAVLEKEISPIDDVRSTSAYRRRVAGNLLERFLADTANGARA